jgi:hypothetical protein
MANIDYALELCIEKEKEKCLEVIQGYYKKNKHPSILRLRDYLKSLSVQDHLVLEDLDKIKLYLTTDEAMHEPFSTDA